MRSGDIEVGRDLPLWNKRIGWWDEDYFVLVWLGETLVDIDEYFR